MISEYAIRWTVTKTASIHAALEATDGCNQFRAQSMHGLAPNPTEATHVMNPDLINRGECQTVTKHKQLQARDRRVPLVNGSKWLASRRIGRHSAGSKAAA